MPESLGKTLKKIRETKHLSIEEVSEKTRIPKKIISGIEEDTLHELSSDFYAKRFIKSYSQFLDALNEKVVKEYLSSKSRKDASNFVLKEVKKTQINFFQKYKRQLIVTLLAILGIWMLFFSFVQMKRFVRHVSGGIKAQREKRKISEPKPKASPVVTEDSKKVEGVNLEILARYNTWIQVEGDGKLLFMGILEKGTKDIWQAKTQIKLELGNAGGVTLSLNGKNLGSPGKKGEKKVIVVTKDGIK